MSDYQTEIVKARSAQQTTGFGEKKTIGDILTEDQILILNSLDKPFFGIIGAGKLLIGFDGTNQKDSEARRGDVTLVTIEGLRHICENVLLGTYLSFATSPQELKVEVGGTLGKTLYQISTMEMQDLLDENDRAKLQVYLQALGQNW